MNVSEERERLTIEAIRALGVPASVISDYELWGALLRDRDQAPERTFDGDVPVAVYDRRGLLNVLAWLAQPRTSEAERALLAVRHAINTRDYPMRTNDEIVALVRSALEEVGA